MLSLYPSRLLDNSFKIKKSIKLSTSIYFLYPFNESLKFIPITPRSPFSHTLILRSACFITLPFLEIRIISAFSSYISDSRNMVYLLNTVGYYTYDDPDATPCPYKLLVGTEKGSTLKDVSSNESYKEIMFSKPNNLKGIRKIYDGTSQSFKILFSVGGYLVEIPITMRTRAAGGWQGKGLFITSSGLKIK